MVQREGWKGEGARSSAGLESREAEGVETWQVVGCRGAMGCSTHAQPLEEASREAKGLPQRVHAHISLAILASLTAPGRATQHRQVQK